MHKFLGLLTGALIGGLLGYFADQFLTSYVLHHTDKALVIIITNALSAFLMLPLFVLSFAVIGYRVAKRRRARPADPIASA